MSCGSGKPNFRLLDVNVGWSASSSMNLGGLSDPDGIYLEKVVAGAVEPGAVIPLLPPARLARGCGECEWYLVTAAPPESLLLVRNACHSEWRRVWDGSCVPEPFQSPSAVAAWADRIAVADSGANQVLIFARSGVKLLGTIAVAMPGPIAFTANGELLVVSGGSSAIGCYGIGGEARGSLKAPLPALGTVLNIAVDGNDAVWVVEQLNGSWTVWSAAPDAALFKQMGIADLQAAFAPSGLLAASSAGFCFDVDAKRGLGSETCFSWYGRPIAQGLVTPPGPPQRQTKGQLLTVALDSGIPRCEWHRVQLDADVPAGTTLSMAVATTEDKDGLAQGDQSREPGWQTFPAGVPHPSDWTSSPAGSTDFLIDQPAGRYLYFRLRLVGNGTATPVVRLVRIDFPRATSLDRMPDVYRETAKAEDFTKRFLSLFDSSVADLDAVIQRYSALLDPVGVPENLLPWLGGFFNIGFDPTWDAATRRKILQNAPAIYQKRGTVAGLQLAVQVVFGVQLSIEQMSSAGPWGSVAKKVRGSKRCDCAAAAQPSSVGRPAQLGAVRLYGRNRSRLYLDRSVLGQAPLRSYGNPDQDPFADGAYRFKVLVPPLPDRSAEGLQRLENLITAQSPAHAVFSLREGGIGFVVGQWTAIGIDTAFVPLAAPVLGASGNVQLNRMTVLWSRPGRTGIGAGIGRNFVVGKGSIAG